MGYPRGPPPGFPPRYSQVMAARGEQVYSPPSDDTRYGYGEGFPTGNMVIPNQSLNVFPGTEVVVPGNLKGIQLLQKMSHRCQMSQNQMWVIMQLLRK